MLLTTCATPLARLRATAEFGPQPGADPATAREALADCVEESERVLEMLNTLMDIAEAEAGTMKLQREPVDLCQLAREIVELYQYVAEEKKITVRIRSPEFASSRFRGPNADAPGIGNLLDNAIKYTPDGGQRHNHRHEPKPNQASDHFKDTGIGIPAEEQEKIWSRLYRGDKSRSQRGLGLGLSLVKRSSKPMREESRFPAFLNVAWIFTVRLPLNPEIT